MTHSRLALAAGLVLLLVAGPNPVTAAALSDSSPGTAQERFQKALAADPGNLALRYYLGVSLLVIGEDRQAVEQFRLAYPAYRDSLEMNYNLALAYTRLGDADSAQIYLARAEELGALEALEIYPLANLYFNLALKQAADDRIEEAIRLYRQALRINPENDEIHRLLGDLHLTAGRPQEAIAAWRLFLDRHPEDSQVGDQLFAAYFNLGLKALEISDHDAARSNFTAAENLFPGSSLPNYYLGYLAYQEGRYVETLDHLARAFPNAPDELRESLLAMTYNSAAYLLEQGQPEAAGPAVELLRFDATADEQGLFLAGSIQLALEQYQQARDIFLRVLERQPGHSGATLGLVSADQGAAEARYGEAVAAYRADDFQRSADHLRATLELNPAHPGAAALLTDAEQNLHSATEEQLKEVREAMAAGRTATALQLLRDILGQDPGNLGAAQLERELLNGLRGHLDQLIADGKVHESRGEMEEAELAFREAVRLDPASAAGHDGLRRIAEIRRTRILDLVREGNAAFEEGRLLPARQSFTTALELAPDHPDALTGLDRTVALLQSLAAEELQSGRRLAQSGRLQEARDHLARALELNPSGAVRSELNQLEDKLDRQIDSLLKAADEALRVAELRKARQLLRKLEAIAPGHPAGVAQLARVEATIQLQVDEALSAARRNLAEQAYPAALVGYRLVLELQPANAEALVGLEHVRQAQTEALGELLTRARTSLEQGDYQLSANLVEQLLALDPFQEQALKFKSQLEIMQRSGLQPGDENRLYLEGIEHYTRGRYEDAVSAWEKVLLLAPHHEKATMNIEKARRKLKQLEAYRKG